MEVLWLVGYLVLGVLTVFFILMYFYATSVMVRPDECQASTGIYGVVPGATGELLQSCGPDADEDCTFEEATLADAVARCDSLGPRVCGSFTYSEKTAEMRVVRVETTPPPAIGLNLYRRRVSALLVGGRPLEIG